MIKKPQKAPSKAITDEQLSLLFENNKYILGSPKLDGYRCTTDGDKAYTSSMKPITNMYIQHMLSSPEYAGLDGELIVGPPDAGTLTFNNTTGAVRRSTGEPDFKLYVFDTWNCNLGYEERIKYLRSLCKRLPYAIWVNQIKLYTPEQIIAYENRCLGLGFEGAMVRTPGGLYKQGRTTLKELNIFKRKPMEDAECTVIGFEEQLQNNNPKTKNEKGESVRSAHKDNKTPKGTLGAFICKDTQWANTFKIATGEGLDDALRQEIWDDQAGYINGLLSYRFQRYGSKDAPRIPTYRGFRDPDDVTDY